MTTYTGLQFSGPIDLSCFYNGSPMLVARASFNEYGNYPIEYFLGAHVVQDVAAFLETKAVIWPVAKLHSIRFLAATGRIWRTFCRPVTEDMQIRSCGYFPILSSPRCMPNPTPHSYHKGRADKLICHEVNLFGTPSLPV